MCVKKFIRQWLCMRERVPWISVEEVENKACREKTGHKGADAEI